MHFEFLPPKKVIHYKTQHEIFVPSYPSNPGHANDILYYFHKSITFLWGKNSKCTCLIMNGF